MITIPSSTGVNILKEVIDSDKNCKIFEKNIRAISVSDDSYQCILYQVIGEFLSGKDKKNILNNLKNVEVEWKHSEFQEIRNNVNEQDEFVENPFEVEEGVLDCGKCNSKKVLSYSKQCRGSDEGTSIFARCLNCGNQWVHGG